MRKPKKNDMLLTLLYTLSMQTKDLFSHSQNYAHSRPAYPPELFSYLATLVQQSRGSCELAWDCACGNGQSAIQLAPYFREVLATDINQHQLDEAFEHDRIIYTRCEAESTPFPDQSFDLITVAQALHWMDYDRFWPEVLRVLRPGGVFATWGYSWIHHDELTQAILDEYIFVHLKDLWHPRNRLLWDGYKKVDFPFDIIPSPQFSISKEWTLDQFMSYIRSWSASQLYISSQGDNFLRLAQMKLEELWSTPTRTMVWDIVLKVAINKQKVEL